LDGTKMAAKVIGHFKEFPPPPSQRERVHTLSLWTGHLPRLCFACGGGSFRRHFLLLGRALACQEGMDRRHHG
jgi:hypothetical protein